MKALKGIYPAAVLLVWPFFFANTSGGAMNATIPGSKLNAGVIFSKAAIMDTGGKKVEGFKREWTQKIEKLNEKISKAEKKINNFKAEDQGILDKKILDWKGKVENLQLEINRADDISTSGWKLFKSNVEKNYNAINGSVDSLYKGR